MRLTREAICAEALTWLGTPFHDLACTKGIGVDCGQLIVGVAQALGVLPRTWRCPVYSPERQLHQQADLISPLLARAGFTPVRWEEKAPGDVLTFRIGLTVSHVAFLLPDHALVHAVVDKGVIRQALQGSWVALHDQAWVFPGVEETPCR